MSTHNIGFHEDMTKIIFQLSSNMLLYRLDDYTENKHTNRKVLKFSNARKLCCNPRKIQKRDKMDMEWQTVKSLIRLLLKQV